MSQIRPRSTSISSTPDDSEARRKFLRAESQRRRRSLESPDSRSLRLSQDSERHARARNQESPASRSQRLLSNSQRNAQARNDESPHTRSLRLLFDSQQHAQARNQESPQSRSQRLTQDAQQHAQARNQESPQSRSQRLLQDAQQHARVFANANILEHTNRNEMRRSSRISQSGLACMYDIDELPIAPQLHESDIGEMNVTCSYCGAVRFSNEHSTICCQNGAISLPNPKLPSPPIWDLYTGNDARSRFFQNHIREFNQALSFASLRAQVDHFPTGGVPTFRIHGQVYHNMGPLLPSDGETPKFCQIYFHDSDNAASYRLSAVSLNAGGHASDIIEILQNEVAQFSPHYQLFQAAIERSVTFPECQLILHADRTPTNEHERRYNAPTSSEIAVLIHGNSDESGSLTTRDFVVHVRGGGVRSMHIENRYFFFLLNHALIFL
jgi:hypothetical protein